MNDQVVSTCSDVEMSIEVFTAMGNHRVFKRCLELACEVFELAKSYSRTTRWIIYAKYARYRRRFGVFANLIDPLLLEDDAFNDSKLDVRSPWKAPDTNPGVESGDALELFLNSNANQ